MGVFLPYFLYRMKCGIARHLIYNRFGYLSEVSLLTFACSSRHALIMQAKITCKPPLKIRLNHYPRAARG